MNYENVADADFYANTDNMTYRTEKIMNDETMENQLYQETIDVDEIHAISNYENEQLNDLNTGFDNLNR